MEINEKLIDFRFTAQEDDKNLSNEIRATFTAKWPEREEWKVHPSYPNCDPKTNSTLTGHI